MFLPDNVGLNKKEEQERREAVNRVELWCMEMIPLELRDDAFVAVREVECGDPNCSPVDTAVTVFFEKGADGIFGIPMAAKDITIEDLKDIFPTSEVLLKWSRGISAEWPPLDFEEKDDEPFLSGEWPKTRFEVGEKVLCRIGPDDDKDWAQGTITQLWFRQSKWPEGSYAPYRIQLDDNREIFAPADHDGVVRRADS